jgi:hypothetical protein
VKTYRAHQDVSVLNDHPRSTRTRRPARSTRSSYAAEPVVVDRALAFLTVISSPLAEVIDPSDALDPAYPS